VLCTAAARLVQFAGCSRVAPVSFIVAMVLAIAGCAFDISHVQRVPTTFVAASGGPDWTLDQDHSIGVGSGFPTQLRHGTHWQLVGRVPEGDVYHTSDQIVTVEASNIFEAMLVVQGVQVAGFYLPVEHSFVAASDRPALPIERRSTP
jgi:hypothetical protein